MDKKYDLLITNGSCVIEHDGELQLELVDIAVSNGKIVEIGSLSPKDSTETYDATGLHVLPGLIDTQVHFREPGLTHKEDIESGSKGALLGGLTGFFEMPNTNPSTTTVEAMQKKLDSAAKTSWTNYAFYIGAAPENIEHLSKLEKIPGCCGIKVFMGSSTGSLLIDDLELLEKVLINTTRKVAVHCEDETRLKERWDIAENSGDVKKHSEWRDEMTAFVATQNLIKLAEKHKRTVHVLHVTTKKEMEYLREHKAYATVETTPQHLTLSSPECYDQLGTLAQMNPPIRTSEHREALWKGVNNDTVDIIGSDHAPHTLEEKGKPYPASPSGMVGVQTTLPILLDHINNGKMTLFRLVELMCKTPSKVFKIKNKGRIEVGYDADFSIVDLEKKFTIKNEWIASKSGWSPFNNKSVKGFPHGVIIAGKICLKNGEIIGPQKGQQFDFE